MNTLERVRDLLSHVTYKPGWTITADWEQNNWESGYTGAWRRVQLTVKCRAKDPLEPNGKEYTITRLSSLHQFDIDHMQDKDLVDYFIYRALWEMEYHEFKEWFRFDGVCIHDPHPEVTSGAGVPK